MRLASLYHVVVPNKGGGTRRDGGYDCRHCGFANQIPASEMPQGLLSVLPSQSEQRKIAAPANTNGLAPVEPPRPIAPPTPTPRPIAVIPLVMSPDDLDTAIRRQSVPAWVAGVEALALLRTAQTDASENLQGFCVAFAREADGTLSIIDGQAQAPSADLLEWLDAIGCELLVIGGTRNNGARWKMVFHPIGGAASLAEELV